MVHLSILMWIKESDNQNTGTFTVLEYLNFTIVNEKISFENFGKGKNCKSPLDS